MQRNGTSERNASQPKSGQPHGANDDEESPQPGVVPSFLTARELQAPEPAKVTSPNEDTGEAVKRKPGEKRTPG